MHKPIVLIFMKIWKASLLACVLACFAQSSSAGELLFSKFGQEKPITMNDLKSGQDLVLFWRSDCAPCLLEIGFLPKISKQFPYLKILLVSLQNKGFTQNHLSKNLPANVEQAVAISDAKAVLQEFGNEKLVLPYSVALRKNGSICAKNYGILGINKINNWIKTCSILKK